MAEFTKEQLIEEVNYNLEHCFCSDKTKRLMEIALAALAGNSPVTPDGWIPVSERMPPQGEPLLVCSGNGVVQRTVYGFDGENWLDWYEQYDPVKAEFDDLWQPLPAAPKQEVK